MKAKEMTAENPKLSAGLAKLPLHLWPATATAMGSIGMFNGMLKYGRNNFRGSPVHASIYIAAVLRHILAFAEGEDADPKDKMPHLAGVLSSAAIIIDADAAGTLVDDRNYNGQGYANLVEKLTPLIEWFEKLHADKNPKHYTIADGKSL